MATLNPTLWFSASLLLLHSWLTRKPSSHLEITEFVGSCWSHCEVFFSLCSFPTAFHGHCTVQWHVYSRSLVPAYAYTRFWSIMYIHFRFIEIPAIREKPGPSSRPPPRARIQLKGEGSGNETSRWPLLCRPSVAPFCVTTARAFCRPTLRLSVVVASGAVRRRPCVG